MHRILRVVPEYSVALSTKERCPFLLVYEMEDLSSEGVTSPKKMHHEEEASSHELWPVEESNRQSENDARDSDETSFTKKFVITKRLGRESSHQMRRTERAAMKKEAVALAASGAFENEPNRPQESFNFQPNVNTDSVVTGNSSEQEEERIVGQGADSTQRNSNNELGVSSMIEVDLQYPTTPQNNQVGNSASDKNKSAPSEQEDWSEKREDAPDSAAHAAFGESFAEKEERLVNGKI